MYKIWIAMRIFLLGAVMLFLAGAAHAQFGKLTVLKGEAVVERGARRIQVKRQLTLLDGYRLKTLDRSKVHIRLYSVPNNAEAILTANTTIAVHELNARKPLPPIRLLFGAIRSRVARSFRTVAFITSPTATIGVKGTDFIVYVKRKVATEFIGVDGLIEAASSSRPEYTLRIGKRQWGEIVEGEKPKPPVRVPDDVWDAALREFSFPR